MAGRNAPDSAIVDELLKRRFGASPDQDDWWEGLWSIGVRRRLGVVERLRNGRAATLRHHLRSAGQMQLGVDACLEDLPTDRGTLALDYLDERARDLLDDLEHHQVFSEMSSASDQVKRMGDAMSAMRAGVHDELVIEYLSSLQSRRGSVDRLIESARRVRDQARRRQRRTRLTTAACRGLFLLVIALFVGAAVDTVSTDDARLQTLVLSVVAFVIVDWLLVERLVEPRLRRWRDKRIRETARRVGAELATAAIWVGTVEAVSIEKTQTEEDPQG